MMIQNSTIKVHLKIMMKIKIEIKTKIKIDNDRRMAGGSCFGNNKCSSTSCMPFLVK